MSRGVLGELSDNSCDIVTELSEVGSEPGISTLIKQELHTWGGGVRFSSTAAPQPALQECVCL
jgi:hypothetical protein